MASSEKSKEKMPEAEKVICPECEASNPPHRVRCWACRAVLEDAKTARLEPADSVETAALNAVPGAEDEKTTEGASAHSNSSGQARRSQNATPGIPMPAVSGKTQEKLVAGLKKFQAILTAARTKDVNEADTVRIITDILSEMFGYDRYSEITSEHGIRGTYCDLAIQVGGNVKLLIEVKAIGLELKDTHLKQAIDYAANKGVDWVILTNGLLWRTYKVAFTKPIDQELVLELDFSALNSRNGSHLEALSVLMRDAIAGSALTDYHLQKQATNKFFLGALLLSEPLLEILRREVRRLSPEARVQLPELKDALMRDVLKREVIEGEKAEAARKKVKQAANRALRTQKPKDVAKTENDDANTANNPEDNKQK